MDAETIRDLGPELRNYLRQFDHCCSRGESRSYFSAYVQAQWSDLPEKSCGPIAVAAGIPPRNMQEFLASYKWDEKAARTCLQQMVINDHAGPHAVGIIDETSDTKKGDKTPGVKRQWCGKTGKKENCMVTVHLGYERDDF